MFNKIVSVRKSMVLFTGGTAANAYTKALHEKTNELIYIIPISDNGGSTGEIQGFIGGPAIGDIRSRLVRLAEDSPIKTILQFRLPSIDNQEKEDPFTVWNDILYMKHPLWEGVPTKFRYIIRAGLNTFNATLQTKIDTTRQFDFSAGSIGNFFFSGERLHFGSLSATIEMFKHVLGIEKNTKVIPIVDINKRLTLGIKMENGEYLKGQSQISHPSDTTHVDKTTTTPLPSKVVKLEYLNKDFNYYIPTICEDVLPELTTAGTIVYSMGSFYTSLLPNLILPGVGEAIKQSSSKKILIMNGSYDRETTYLDKEGNKQELTFEEFLSQLKDALNRYGELSNELSDYVTDVIFLEGSVIKPSGNEETTKLKIHLVEPSLKEATHYSPEKLVEKLLSIAQ